MDYEVPKRTRKPATRAYLHGLNPRHTPPTPATTTRIITVIRELMEDELRGKFASMRASTGGTFLGEQTDMLTKRHHSYVTLNGTYIDNHGGSLTLVPFVMDYNEFPANSHTAEAIRDWWKEVHRKFGLSMADIGTPTTDGAANGRKAVRLTFGRCGRYCINHNGARSVLKGIDKKDKTIRNPEGRKLIAKFRKWSRFARVSTKYHQPFSAAQVQLLGQKIQLTTPNATRWDGDVECLENGINSEPAAMQVKQQLSQPTFLSTTPVQAKISSSGHGESSSDEEQHSDDSSIEISSGDEPTDDGQEIGRTTLAPPRSKKILPFVERVAKYTPSADEFNKARDLQAAMSLAKQLTKLTQSSNEACGGGALAMARSVITASRADEIWSPVWQKVRLFSCFFGLFSILFG